MQAPTLTPAALIDAIISYQLISSSQNQTDDLQSGIDDDSEAASPTIDAKNSEVVLFNFLMKKKTIHQLLCVQNCHDVFIFSYQVY